MQKIWVCGARGQIGQAVNDVVDKLEFEMLDTNVDDLDVTDTDEVLRFGEMNRPDIIINCSGMTDISSCEENPSQAFKVNALGARNLAIVAAKMQAKMFCCEFFHIVFPRKLGHYKSGNGLWKVQACGGKLCERIHNKTFYRAEHLGVWKGTEFYQWFLKKSGRRRAVIDCLRPVWITDERKRTGKIFITSGAYERVRNLSCDKQGRVQPLCVCTGDFENDRKDGFHAAGSNCHVGFFQGETGVCGTR